VGGCKGGWPRGRVNNCEREHKVVGERMSIVQQWRRGGFWCWEGRETRGWAERAGEGLARVQQGCSKEMVPTDMHVCCLSRLGVRGVFLSVRLVCAASSPRLNPPQPRQIYLCGQPQNKQIYISRQMRPALSLSPASLDPFFLPLLLPAPVSNAALCWH